MEKVFTVTLQGGKTTDVFFADSIKDLSSKLSSYGLNALWVFDTNTAPLFKNLPPNRIVLESGEKSKNWKSIERIISAALDFHLARDSYFIAFGGGVVCDMTALASSLYMRGTKLILVPTTLLCMVDASVGGKTAVNLEAGKNLMGAFYQPSLVICDCDTFETLPEEVYREGLAEAIKYGVILDNELFNKFKEDALKDIESIIEQCVYLKGQIVSEDEFDKGQRQLLNFGHTIGHAIEKCSSFTLPHGFAVAMGMIAITRASENSGLCEKGSLKLLEEVLQKYKLPTSLPYSSTELSEAALSDKKRLGDTITLVVPERIGSCILHKISVEDLKKFIDLGRELK